jgi:Fe-S oxidoreductase
MLKTSKLTMLSNCDTKPLFRIEPHDLMTLPNYGSDMPSKADFMKSHYRELEGCLDGASVLGIAKPKSAQDEAEFVRKFVSGLKKLLSPKYNWTFYQPLLFSIENCVHCHTCDDVCPIYIASGRKEAYRPNFRLEVLQELKKRYIDLKPFDLLIRDKSPTPSWILIARLAELAYRCTLCRRCAQVCPMGVNNGLVARELRKLFSQEMGIAPREIHEMGTVQQLAKDKPISPLNQTQLQKAVFNLIGKRVNLPIDKSGADYLVVCSIADFPDRIKCAATSAIFMNAAGLNWTFSNEIDVQTNNFGIWYDDIQLFRIVKRQTEIARNLKAKKIVISEWCGHASNALIVLSDRISSGEPKIPRETYLPILEDLICNQKIEIKSQKIDFPVTLHDPCNLVRQMGIVNPQRRILNKICSDFREMQPHGVENYCCGGGSGMVFMESPEVVEWRRAVAGRMKIKQILETFKDVLDKPVNKFVCTPCVSCQIQINGLLDYYGLREKYHIYCGGLLDLVLNTMKEVKNPPLLFNKTSIPHPT